MNLAHDHVLSLNWHNSSLQRCAHVFLSKNNHEITQFWPKLGMGLVEFDKVELESRLCFPSRAL